MKALILAGGLGTRLRPLTYSMPKPLVPLLGKPLVCHILDSLPEQVDTVVLAVSYMKETLEDYFRENDVGRKVILVNEDQPLGTGGAMKNVSRYLDGTFIAFNGDVVSSLDLDDMLRFHRSHGGIGTMSLWQVDDPSAFGVVGLDGTRIVKFQEKPKKEEACSNLINAGTYIFEDDIFDHIPDGVVSIEKKVFPNVLDKGLYGYKFSGHWVDCGTRESFLKAQSILLAKNGRSISKDATISRDAKIVRPDMVQRAEIGDSVVGPDAYIEEGAVIGNGCRIVDSMVLKNAKVFDEAIVEHSIIGPGVVVGKGTRVSSEVLANIEKE